MTQCFPFLQFEDKSDAVFDITEKCKYFYLFSDVIVSQSLSWKCHCCWTRLSCPYPSLSCSFSPALPSPQVLQKWGEWKLMVFLSLVNFTPVQLLLQSGESDWTVSMSAMFSQLRWPEKAESIQGATASARLGHSPFFVTHEAGQFSDPSLGFFSP